MTLETMKIFLLANTMDDNHLKNLINIYNIAPINKFYKPKMNLSLLTVTAVFGLFLTTTMLVFTIN